MKSLTGSIYTVFTAVALACSCPTFANTLAVNQSDATPLNFDLTGLSPAAPYKSIALKFTLLESNQPTSNVWFAMYGATNGLGFITQYPWGNISSWNNGVIELSTANPIYDSMLDGVFSLKIWAEGTGVKMSSVAAAGQTWNPDFSGYARTDYQTVNMQPVPEPTTALLMILGLGGVFCFRKLNT